MHSFKEDCKVKLSKKLITYKTTPIFIDINFCHSYLLIITLFFLSKIFM